MLGKFKGGLDWVNPLALHAGVHGVFTFLICLVFLRNSEYGFPNAIALAWFDFIAHFVVDRVKASPKMLGRFKSLTKEDFEKNKKELDSYYKYLSLAVSKKDLGSMRTFENVISQAKHLFNNQKKSNKYFWWSLGADQMAHHLTHYLIIYLIMRSI